jgi:glutamate 5-kinase
MLLRQLQQQLGGRLVLLHLLTARLLQQHWSLLGAATAGVMGWMPAEQVIKLARRSHQHLASGLVALQAVALSLLLVLLVVGHPV